MNQQLSIAQQEQAVRSFLPRVYLWMLAALVITAAVAFAVSSSPALLELIFSNPLLPLGLMILQVVIVIALGVAIDRLSPIAATIIFFLYAALTGIVFSTIFIAYTETSIASTFIVTAGMFGIMSIIGMSTGKDLTAVGNIGIMALVGIILASLLNFFMRSEAIYWLISFIGVGIFVGLIAYDAQRLKQMATQVDPNSPGGQRASIMGALALYLDFINLFLFLLRFLGRRD